MEKQKRNSALPWIALLLVTVVLLGSLALNGILAIGLGMRGLPATGGQAEDEYPDFMEQWSYGQGSAKVVRIAMNGVISREASGGWFDAGVDPVSAVLSEIRAARHDDEVEAIIMEINSPGGGVTASDEIYAALMRFKESREGRVVVAFTQDMAASGGYYIAAAADWIVAQPTSIVGSIGVIMQTLNWEQLSRKIGVQDTTIKSGQNKDLLNPFSPVDPEQIGLLQEMIDAMYERFVGIVSRSRGINRERLTTLADGRIFTSRQAVENGLIDQVGYWDDVVDKMAELLDEDSVRVVRYYREAGLWDTLFQVRAAPPALRSLSPAPQGPSLQYLWKP